MLGSSVTNGALRYAWTRFAPQGKPFIGTLRKSFSTVNRKGSGTCIRPCGRPKHHQLKGRNNDLNLVSKRTIKQSAPKDESSNMVLIVGLGALGIATIAAYKADIFVPEGKQPPQQKTDKEVKELEEKVSHANPEETEEDESAKDQDAGQLEDKEMSSEENDQELTEVIAETLKIIEEDISSGEDIIAKDVDISSLESTETSKFEEETCEEQSADDATSQDAILDNVTLEATGIEAKVNSSTSETHNDSTLDINLIQSPESLPEKEEQAENEAVNQEQAPKETGDVPANEITSVVEENSKIQTDLPKIPSYAPYVIIGAGTASHAACRAIRKREPTAKILVIGDEEVLPYMRPPLSKELWHSEDEDTADTLFFKQWNGKKRSLFFEEDTYYVHPQLLPVQEKGGIAVLTGHRVINIDPVDHSIQLKNGAEVKYDKLLIATGGHPKSIQLFENSEKDWESKVTLFRTVADYRKLEKLVNNIDSVAIIGGGFLGSELACALGYKGKESQMDVFQIYHEEGNMGKVLPHYLSKWTTAKVQSEGVKTFPNAELADATLLENGKVSLQLKSGETVNASHVVVCVGIEPNTDLAFNAGLEVDPEHGGFRVNAELQARSDVWVAGDAACFYDVKLGRRRVEHHDHAVVSGRLAGENMTGEKKSYLHQSMFWSDLGPDVGYEAIGIVDNTLDTVGVWAKATKEDSPKAVVEATSENLRSQTEEDAETGETVKITREAKDEELSEDFGKGVVFYLREEVVVGILLWNVFNKMPVARKILKEGKKQESLVELAKLFSIHD